MILVPAGSFWMGSDNQAPDQAPRHLVNLDAFEIDRYEVTNERYKRFIDAGGYGNRAFWSADGWAWVQRHSVKAPQKWNQPGWNAPSQPVIGVYWYEAEAFCRFEDKRLPTEAEWEKAARGTDERLFPWGNQWDAARAQGPGAKGTAIVGAHPDGASPYGVEDMAGNAWEWVADWYRPGYAGSAPVDNPTGPVAGGEKVLRGGSWRSSDTSKIQSSAREFITVDPSFHPIMRLDTLGFRCARSVT